MTGFGVGRQRFLQVIGQTEIIHDQAAGLVFVDTVDARNGLHQTMPLHGFVNVHGVQRRDIETRQPHIADDDDLERVVGVLEAFGKFFAACLGADVLLPVQRIGGIAGHHDLDHALLVIVGMPFGAEFDDGVVQVHADAAGHAHDHRLAVHRFQALLEMLDQIFGNQADAFLGAHNGFERRPFGLEFFLLLEFFAFGDLFKFRVDLRASLFRPVPVWRGDLHNRS